MAPVLPTVTRLLTMTVTLPRRIYRSLAVACLSVLALAGTLGAAPVYPVNVGPTGRYLVDRDGVPFLIVGDSPQSMIGNLSPADAELFFADRQARGFNTVWINLLCASYTGCNADGSTFDGIAPFNVPGDLTTPNEAYFARVDTILRLAARYGLLVIVDPAETGDWLEILYANGEQNCRAYGQYLGRRYAGFDNILWMHGNDYQEWGPEPDQFTTAVARGIKDADDRHLHTVELNFLVSSSTDDPAWAPIIDLNAAYSYDPPHAEILKDYNRNDGLPVFLVEAAYENEGADPLVVRSQAYGAVLSGATGQLYGHGTIWPFLSGWQDALNAPGAAQMPNFAALFQSRPWWDLVPDQDSSVIVSGRRDFGSEDYAPAARTSDGSLVLAYVPSARTLKVDMSRLSGPVVARWYDPTSGNFVAIADGLPNSGLLDIDTPGDNAEGREDWVLVLEAVPGPAPSFVTLTIASDTYRPGSRLEVSLEAFNTPRQTTRALYAGLLGPDGRTIVYFTGPNTVGGTVALGAIDQLRPLGQLAPGQHLVLAGSNSLLSLRIPSGLPAGVYTWFAGLVAPGALSSRSLDLAEGDILAVRAINLLP
jgi:Protein of unknown function (DUF4038)/Putative collagen-binding domain of a collagenase